MRRVFHYLGSLALLGVLLVACTQPDSTDPTLAVTGPLGSTDLVSGATVTITGTAGDDVAVASVTVQLNDGEPMDATFANGEWSVTFAAPAAGEHSVKVTATDTSGNSASVTLSFVTIDADEDPEPGAVAVSITKPADGTDVHLGSGVKVQGSAAHESGIASVQVFVDDSHVGDADYDVDTESWSFQWHAPDVAGTLKIHAVAKAKSGDSAKSGSVSLIVADLTVGAASGQVERVPPLGSGRPLAAATDAAALVGGLAAELAEGNLERGGPGLARRALPELNRIVVQFAPSRLILSASANSSEITQWQASIDAIAQDFSSYGVVNGSGLVPGQGIAVFEVATGADIDATLAGLNGDPRIQYAERDYWVHSETLPNDPGLAFQWAHEITDAQVAWSVTTGSPSVRVAVVDSGSAGTIGAESQTGMHPDLMANLIPGFDFVSHLDLEGDPLWIDTPEYLALKARYPQAQFLDGDEEPGWDPYPLDEFGTVWDVDTTTGENWISGLAMFGSHGTHVAGIVGAVGNNASGLAGVNWNVEIQPIRALGHIGAGMGSDVLAGVAYAAGFVIFQDGLVYRNPTPAQVINMSLGGGPYSEIAEDLYAAVREENVLVIASAGNSSTDAVHYPSGYDSVMSVSSLDYIHWVDELNGPGVAFSDIFSNYGDTIDISAPGGLAWRTADALDAWNTLELIDQPYVISSGWEWFDSEDPATATYLDTPIYYYSAGTSMSAPYVAGAAALVLSVDPTLTADEVEAILTGTASRVDDSFLVFSYGDPEADWDPYFGYGALNLPAAIAAAKSGVVKEIPAKTYVEAVSFHDSDKVYRVLAESDYTFEFDALPAGKWTIRAGVDVNGNDKIGDSGEYYGEFDSYVIISDAQPVAGDVSFILEREP